MNFLTTVPNGSFSFCADTPFRQIGILPPSIVSLSRTWVTMQERFRQPRRDGGYGQGQHDRHGGDFDNAKIAWDALNNWSRKFDV